MNLNSLASAVLWAIGSGLVSLILSAIFMRFVLGLKFRDVITEIEEDHNLGVASYFGFFVFIVNLFVGAIATDGFSGSSTSISTDLAWVAFGFIVPAALSVVTCAMAIAYGGTRRDGEGLFGYLRREIVHEDNAALAVLTISLSAMWFLPFWFQII